MPRKKLLHIRSNVVENGAAKLPTSQQIEYGEIAINFADGYETLSIRNSNDEIVKFSNDAYFESILSEDEEITSAALNDLNTRKADRTEIPEVSDYFDSVSYNSTDKKIYFYNNNVQKGYVDATDFIKDGMVSSVSVEDVTSGGTTVKCLVITFNTDAGKENINIPVSDIFDSSLYYTKTEADNLFGKVDDVTISGASIVSNKVAEIPIASSTGYGIVIVDEEMDKTSTNPVSNAAISAIISEDEKVTASALNDLNTRKADKTDIPEVSGYFDDAEYNSTGRTIDFYNDGVLKASINANDFIYIDDVSISGVSIVNNKKADIPVASATGYGVVIIDDLLDSGSTNPVSNSAITFAIVSNEKVVSFALNDLNTRKADKTDIPEVSGYFDDAEYDLTGRTIDFYNDGVLKAAIDADDFIYIDDVSVSGVSIVNNKKVDIPIANASGYGLVILDDELDEESNNAVSNSAITKVILENELIMSTALSDLDERIDAHSADTLVQLTTLNTKVNILSSETNTSVTNLETIVGTSDVEEFDVTKAYVKGDFVMYNGKLYKFTSSHAAGAWNTSHVIETSLINEMEDISKLDYEEVIITLQDESGTPISGVSVAVQVEGEQSARNFTSDTSGQCTTNVTKGLEYTVSANNVNGYYPQTPLVRRASLPTRYVNVVYIEDDTLTVEHLVVTFSYSDATLPSATTMTVSYGGNDYSLAINNNVAETDIPLGTVYTISFEEINGYRTPNNRTFTAEHHGNRPLNIRYQTPVSGIKWLMSDNTERELTNVTNQERENGEIFGLIVQTSDLQAEGCSYVIPLDILMNSASKSGQWMSVQEEISQISNYSSHTTALADKNGEENCQKILDYISGSTKTSSMVSGCKNMVGGAPTFSTANTYNVGDYVVYSGNLYTFTVQHNPSAFDPLETSGPMKGYLMPDGVVRQCFSPAYCQLYRFRENNSQVSVFTDDEFELQCINVATENWWSSSQFNTITGIRLVGGSFNNYYTNTKTTTSNLLPVLAY